MAGKRKHVEKVLRASEARVRSVFEQANDGIYILSVDNRYLDANPRGCELLGYRREDLLRMSVGDTLAPHELARLAVELPRMMSGAPYLAQWEHRRRDGTTFPGEVSARRLEDGTCLAIVRDLTARKQVEQELREYTSLLRVAGRIACFGGWSVNLAEGRVIWSDEVAAIHDRPSGFSPTLAEGINYYTPEWRDKITEVFGACAREGIPYDEELQILTARGRRVWVRAVGEAVRDTAGAIVRVQGAFQDITQRKHGEAVLRYSQEQLRALSARLENLREEERTRISREIHDELGQMLTGIKMDLRWIEHCLDALGDDRRLNPVLDKVVATTELADATIKTVQRIASELRPGILDKLGLAMALQYEASRFEQHTGMACRLVLPEEDPPLSPQAATAFFRIFQEALTNVARHAHATAIEVELCPSADACRLEIRDNGCGIAGLDLANPKSLGLLGMQERARISGGDVVFSPRPGGGTVVSVTIPNPTTTEPSL
jgi:PAS domain S-box-containing protein